MTYEKKIIEGNFPCGQVGAETRRERDTGLSPAPNRLHVWWARRPLTPSRAAILGSILPADVDADEFIKELGIRKYQANICGTWIDIPDNILEKNGYSLSWDRDLEKVVKEENKLRKELREICSQLIDKAPQIVDDENFKKLLKRSAVISETPFIDSEHIQHRLVSANPVWFNEIMSICAEYGIRVPNLYGYDRAYKKKPSHLYPQFTLLDCTAGGGSIPFEAMRIGCNVIANDLNPVASAIELATLKYPVQFGKSLLDNISNYADELLLSVGKKLTDYYYMGNNEERVTSFLFHRTVTCPHCGERAPLLNAFALQKKADGWMVLPKIEGEPGQKKVRFIPTKLVKGKGPQGENPDNGTVTRGVGNCLHCGQVIESEEIKKQAQGISEIGKWSDDLYCVVAKRLVPKIGKDGKPMIIKSGPERGNVKMVEELFFREPGAEDYAALKRAEQALQDNWERWEDINLIPTERVPEGNDARPQMYGSFRWCDMFTPRQLLAHLTAMETLQQMIPEIEADLGEEKGHAVIHYLQYMLDKGIDYNSRQTRWIPQRTSVSGTFGRHDFSLKWTFGELVYTGNNSGLEWGKSQVLDAYKGICELLSNIEDANVTITNGSAAALNVEDKTVDIICLDPPYYNNVQYAELSDYFYVWQKRTFRAIYPEWFNRRLTNKDDEAVANPVRDGCAKEADKVYEQRMSEIFAECRRVIKNDGIMTMMFTHKSQEAWETLTKALIENGWIITSAFPVDSEFAASMHQKDMAAAASSIFIACRKRDLSKQEFSVWKGFGGIGVLQKLREAVRDSLKEYDALKLNAVDEMVASYGSALKVLSENWPVMDGDEQVTPIKAMREASTVVAQYQLTRLTEGQLSVNDVNPEAGIALTLFGIYGINYLPYDDALSLSRSLNITLANKTAGYVVESDMLGINDERTGRNTQDDSFEGYFAPVVRKTNKLRLVMPEERAKKRLEQPQTEWDIMQGLIMAYREGEIPVARAYMETQAQGKEAKVIGILKVWADGCGSEELKKEAQRILFGLK